MNIGWHDICLKASNLEESKLFYQALGFDVTHDSDSWVHLSNGNLEISLMTFLEENWINFRGADVFAVYETLKEKGLTVEGAPELYKEDAMGADGAHWNTRDPEGNVVYFDTTTAEASQAKQVEYLVMTISRYLEKTGIESAVFPAFAEDLKERYLNDRA